MKSGLGCTAAMVLLLVGLASCTTAVPQKYAVSTENAPQPYGNASQAVKSGGVLYISSQYGLAPGRDRVVPGGIFGETQQALQNIDAILAAAGHSVHDVVSVRVHLRHLNDYVNVQMVFDNYFKDPPPIIDYIEVSGLPWGALVSISATASP
jgi:2-iminobutanoate/2-iminopropanoate deaminase